MKYLVDRGWLRGDVLDFGCGKGGDADELGFDKFDPHFFPDFNPPGGGYDAITCIYVLNVLENPIDRGNVERRIMTFLKPGGTAFLAVRNDKKQLKGRTSKGTWQGFVEPSEEWKLIRTTAQFRLYVRTKRILAEGEELMKIFNREDAEYLTLHAAGPAYRVVDGMQYDYNLEDIREQAKTKVQAAIWLADHGAEQEIVIKIARVDEKDDEMWDYELTIDSDGRILMRTMCEGCIVPLKNATLCYERVLRKLRPEIFQD